MVKHVDSGGQVHLVTNIRKPRKWRRYEYLQSSGTLYIDSGYLMNGDNYEINIDALQGTTSETIYGFLATTQLCTLFLGDIYWNGSTSAAGTNRNKNIGTSDTFTSRFTLNIKANNGTINYKLNNTTGSYACSYTSFSGVQHNMHIFASNYYNNDHRYSTGRIYRFYIKQNGNLIRDFVPAQYNGQYGMWDLVEDKFYRNAGTGTFTVGPEMKNYDEIDEVRKTSSLLPAGVELYDYILSSGTLYIDTGVIANQDISTELKAQYTNINYGTSLWPALIGAADNNTKRFCIRALDTKKIQGVFGSTSYGTATVDTSIHTYKLSKTLFVIDSTSINVTSSTFSSYSMYLFTENHLNNSGYEYRMASAKMYYCKIWNGSTLVRNFLPCTYLGEPGMWDTVENKFYRNQGTGLFTLGNKITLKEYEYLLNDGNAYINTNYNVNDGNVFKFTYLDVFNNGTKVTGSSENKGYGQGTTGSSAANYSGGGRIWSGTIMMFLNSNNTSTGISSASSTEIYTETLDVRTSSIYIKFESATTVYIDKIVNSATKNTGLMYLYRDSCTQFVYPGVKKIYKVTITKNGVLDRDFIPVSYNGTPGLWDKVEWKFYANTGSGSFTLGPEKANGIYPVWTRIEYLLSDNNSYINTAYVPNGNTRVITDIMILDSNSQNKGIFGSFPTNTWTDRSYALYLYLSNNLWNNYNNDKNLGNSYYSIMLNNITHIDKNKNVLYINNEVAYQNTKVTFNSNVPMHIFGINKPTAFYSKFKLYYFKIYDDDVLVRDFIPIRIGTTGALYDKVEGKIYFNSGTGNFTLGPDL